MATQTRRSPKKSIQKHLNAQLTRLETEQLVRRVDTIEYFFKHTLTQETVYESLLRSSRREIHTHVAHAIESLFAKQLDDYAALLAQHYAEANEQDKTLEYSIRAGDVAARVYANAEAIMHYTRAIETAQRMPSNNAVPLKELFLKRGRVLELCGRYDDALTNYIDMVVYAGEHHDPSMELEALLARALLHNTPTPLQNLELGHGLLDKALARAREIKDRTAECKTLWNMMLVQYFGGHQAYGAELGEQALAIARELNAKELVAFVSNDLARNYAAIGELEKAKATLDEARALWQDLGNLPMLADNYATAADTAFTFGEYAHALEFAEQAYRISKSIGNFWNQSYSRWVMGSVYFEQGKFQDAIAALNETIDLGTPSGFIIATWVSRIVLALLYSDLGLVRQAIAQLEPYIDQARMSDVTYKAWGLGTLGYLHVLDGNIEQANAFIEEAMRDANMDDLGNLVPIMLTLAQGELAIMHREFDYAEQINRSLLDKYNAAKIHVFKSEVILLLGNVLYIQGKTEQAHDLLKQARIEAETIGIQRVLWKILALLAEIEMQLGNHAEAQSLRDQARTVIDYIAAHSPVDLRESFLNLPTVRNILGTV